MKVSCTTFKRKQKIHFVKIRQRTTNTAVSFKIVILVNVLNAAQRYSGHLIHWGPPRLKSNSGAWDF